jgi:hypothetical protein
MFKTLSLVAILILLGELSCLVKAAKQNKNLKSSSTTSGSVEAASSGGSGGGVSNDYCFGNFCIDRKEFGFVLNLQHKLDQCERDLQAEVRRKSKKQLDETNLMLVESTPDQKNKLNTFLDKNPQFKFVREFDNHNRY